MIVDENDCVDKLNKAQRAMNVAKAYGASNNGMSIPTHPLPFPDVPP